jgi:hypothetical protein
MNSIRFARPFLLACLIMCAFVPAARAAAGTPAWSLYVTSSPTNFAPNPSFDTSQSGPLVVVNVFNIGDGATTGQMVITDSLPVGLRPSAVRVAKGTYGQAAGPGIFTCESAGQNVTCRSQGPALQAGQEIELSIPVEVEATAPTSVVDEVRIEGGAAKPVSANLSTAITSEIPSFGFLPGASGLSSVATEPDGTPDSGAGSHPSQLAVSLGFPAYTAATDPAEPDVRELLASGGGVRDLSTVLPAGVVADPTAVPKCTEAELEAKNCSDSSQVGTIVIKSALEATPGEFFQNLYNMVPPKGVAGELGFEVVEGTYVHLLASVNSEGRYEIAADANDILAKSIIFGARAILWGNPSDPSHDAVRGRCIGFTEAEGKTACPVPRTATPFLTMPTSCGGPSVTSATADSWLAPGDFTPPAAAESTDVEGNPVGVEGCSALKFEPSISTRLSSSAGESPSGLEFRLHQNQSLEFEGRSAAALKNTTVTFPEGLVLNPSAGNNREACSSAQIGLLTAVGQMPVHFTGASQSCPNSAKLGTVEVDTPLLDHPLPGSLYLAKPFDNPSGSLLGVYLVVEDPISGVIAKLYGKVTPDQTTGQLTTSFEESPQLPLEDVKLNLFEGPRAALTSPLTCGEKTSTSTLTPWSTPEGADAHPMSSFQISTSCAASEAAAPKNISFMAGTTSPLSGVYSPFVLRLPRPDGSQHITGLETTLPEGLLGKLAGVSYCPESGIAQAISREYPEQGKLEQSSPSCPQSSEVGTVDVTAGSGSTPVPVSGHAYLAGPYKGAPLSLVVIVPAVTGPFDLGTVVDRVALNVDEYTAQIHAVADPLPTIRDGIPLDVRSIELKLTRSQFTLNPTSCEAKAIEGSVSTQVGQTANLDNRFQVGQCGRLAFKPKIAISLKGPTKRTGLPALKATVTYPQGGAYANIARAQVSLPHSEFLEQGNIGLACTKPVLQAHACPAKSVYGKAKAWSPLLAQPLEGPVYLVGGYGYKLPAMVAELDGQIRVLLVGKVDSGPNKGIRNTFEAVPDAPVEKFTLELKGGKKYGLLVNSENICKKNQVAGAAFKAQNGRKLTLSTTIANDCKHRSKARTTKRAKAEVNRSGGKAPAKKSERGKGSAKKG